MRVHYALVLAGHAQSNPTASFWLGLGCIAVSVLAIWALIRRARR